MNSVDLTPAQKLARRFVASYFSVGDLILYGKYKNKKGRILEFGHDPKGNPTITIEPLPKGRKQNKLMGLFKIWKAPLEKQGQTMSITRRVVARFIQAEGFPIGKTFDFENFRVHRFSGNYQITDLTNAGKRGKKVKVLSVGLGNGSETAQQEWLEGVAKAIPHMHSYEQIKNYIKGLKQDDPYVYFDEREVRGIDVNPGGTTKIQLETNTGLIVEAEPMRFDVLNRVLITPPNPEKKPFYQDTHYFSLNKKDAAPFYNWFKANLSEANKLDLEGFKKLWDSLGIRWDSH